MAWKSASSHFNSTTPILYLNFRLFSSAVADAKERAWYTEMETLALEQATFAVALSEKDKQSLCELLNNKELPIEVLLPPLRGDVKELASLDHKELQQDLPKEVASALADGSPGRRLVTCVARLSPEKHVENFVKFVKANRATLDEHDWIPLLAGSTADEEYADTIKQELRKAAPHAIIINSFLSPRALTAVFTRTILNFHPCEYDAYGMTIIEAAALGVASIVEANGAVGASVVVGNGASIEVDMTKGHCWEKVTFILNDEEMLQEIGQEAKIRALAWDETAYGKKLLQYLHAALKSNEST